MDVITQEVVLKNISLGAITIELSVHDVKGYVAYVTARDADRRRIWRTPVMGHDGNPITFETVHEAILEAQQRLSDLRDTNPSTGDV